MNVSSLDLLEQLNTKVTVKNQNEIKCNNCKEHSGYNTEDIRLFRGTKDLNCKHCKKVVIRINPPTEMQLLLNELELNRK